MSKNGCWLKFQLTIEINHVKHLIFSIKIGDSPIKNILCYCLDTYFWINLSLCESRC